MAVTTIWHNPRCSKSRQTLALLAENNITPTIRLYLKEPVTAMEIEQLQQQLGLPLIEIMRTKDAAFKEANLSKDSTKEELQAALLENSALLERPIVTHDGKAAIGRPPEQVLVLF
ncbi:MAG: arsenate reductase (glutaredoxin) [Pseudoruegeria sp.]